MSKSGDRDPDLSDEYDFSRGKRGVHHASASRGIRVHLVTDDEDRARMVGKPAKPRVSKPAKTR